MLRSRDSALVVLPNHVILCLGQCRLCFQEWSLHPISEPIYRFHLGVRLCGFKAHPRSWLVSGMNRVSCVAEWTCCTGHQFARPICHSISQKCLPTSQHLHCKTPYGASTPGFGTVPNGRWLVWLPCEAPFEWYAECQLSPQVMCSTVVNPSHVDNGWIWPRAAANNA